MAIGLTHSVFVPFNEASAFFEGARNIFASL